MNVRSYSKSIGRALIIALVAMMPVALAAQAAPTKKGAITDSPSKWDIFVGICRMNLRRHGEHGQARETISVVAGRDLFSAIPLTRSLPLRTLWLAESVWGGPSGRTPRGGR